LKISAALNTKLLQQNPKITIEAGGGVIFGFCCKSMVLGAALIQKAENKCSTYFQGKTVNWL
jgi:hypothetical protein